MTRPRILIAGIGNIFMGDDAFGTEVLRRILECELPEEVRAQDFGIRGYDLTYALADDHEITILVDATPRGDPPGTLYLLELDLSKLETTAATIDAHSLNPVAALQLTQSLGLGCQGRFYLIGCEPATLDCAEGDLGLSEPVAAAVPGALAMLERLLRDVAHLELNLNPRNSHAVPS